MHVRARLDDPEGSNIGAIRYLAVLEVDKAMRDLRPAWIDSALTRNEIWRFAANPFQVLSVVLHAPIAPIECSRRIRARQANDPDGPDDRAIGPRERYPIWADISEDAFTIVKRLPGHWTNPQQIQVSGRLQAVHNGTLIYMRFTERRLNAGIHIAMAAFLLVCSIGLMFAPGSISVGSVLIGCLVFAVGYTMLTVYRVFCVYLARNEPQWITRFIRETLGADVVETPG
jgi:hypothetical protein